MTPEEVVEAIKADIETCSDYPSTGTSCPECLHGILKRRITAALDAARKEERQACAEVARDFGYTYCGEPVMGDRLANDIAAAIEARGEK